MIKKFIMMAGLLMLCHFASAYKQKEVFVYSESMRKDVPVTVITPDGYWKGKNYPVVYILHGYSDNNIDRWTYDGHVGRLNMTHLIKPGLNIIFDCGTGDFFYEVNCNLHNKLLEAEIPHDYCVRPGQHNWEYWYNAVKYQFQFFNDRFGK